MSSPEEDFVVGALLRMIPSSGVQDLAVLYRVCNKKYYEVIYVRWLDVDTEEDFHWWPAGPGTPYGRDEFEVVTEDEKTLLYLAYPQLAEAVEKARRP